LTQVAFRSRGTFGARNTRNFAKDAESGTFRVFRGFFAYFALQTLLLLLLTACASYPHEPLRPATPVPTATPRPIVLPADDTPHQDLTEWWYYTGHLKAASGPEYGFEYVIFQIERAGAPPF